MIHEAFFLVTPALVPVPVSCSANTDITATTVGNCESARDRLSGELCSALVSGTLRHCEHKVSSAANAWHYMHYIIGLRLQVYIVYRVVL